MNSLGHACNRVTAVLSGNKSKLLRASIPNVLAMPSV